MIKKYMKTLIATSLLCLTPIIAGVILWDRLPDTLATHFGADNTPNGWSSKVFAVFGLPMIILVLEWICMIGTNADPKSKNLADSVMMKIVLWMMPCLSILVSGLTYIYALGYQIKIGMIVISFMGILFVVMGNYLPKCKQSYTMGIKLPWTLANAENWNRTHRLAGKLWVAGGMVILATAALENPVIFIGILFVMIAVPTVYSYRLYKAE